MQKVKQELTTSANQLRLANQKAEGLTIKKLTYGNPTIEMFKITLISHKLKHQQIENEENCFYTRRPPVCSWL